MGLKAWLERVIARAFPQTADDWAGDPGVTFGEAMTDIANSTHAYRITEKVKEAADLGWKKLEGAATHERNKALLDAAKTEEAKTKAELQRRTADEDVRQNKIRTKLLESEIRKNNAEAFRTLVETLMDLGVAPDLSTLRISPLMEIEFVSGDGLYDEEKVRIAIESRWAHQAEGGDIEIPRPELPSSSDAERGVERQREPHNLFNSSIGMLGLSGRLKNCLESEGIRTIRELVTMTEQDLLKIRGFGKASLKELERHLDVVGLGVGSHIDPPLQRKQASSVSRHKRS